VKEGDICRPFSETIHMTRRLTSLPLRCFTRTWVQTFWPRRRRRSPMNGPENQRLRNK
jgi:hypothetical protein